MAWVEILKENHPNDELIPEMDKDVKRLERIAERFSKIGSLPEPKEGSMNEVLTHVVEYMRHRTSDKVEIICNMPDHDVKVMMNASLFEWVIENLCKNAVDAMDGSGQIELTLMEDNGHVAIEVADGFPEAFDKARQIAGEGIICAFGSLYSGIPYLNIPPSFSCSSYITTSCPISARK